MLCSGRTHLDESCVSYEGFWGGGRVTGDLRCGCQCEEQDAADSSSKAGSSHIRNVDQ